MALFSPEQGTTSQSCPSETGAYVCVCVGGGGGNGFKHPFWFLFFFASLVKEVGHVREYPVKLTRTFFFFLEEDKK